MKKRLKLPLSILLVYCIALFYFASCRDKESPSPKTEAKADTNQVVEANEMIQLKGGENERRGGNGNGGGGGQNNPNTPNYNPCANYEIYPIENTPAQNWNAVADTSLCGYLIIRWDAQPNFSSVVDSCNTLLGKYFISITPVVPDGMNCAGTYSTTNSFYYIYGAGCSIWGGNKEYLMSIYYYQRDTTNKVTRAYSNQLFRFTTGAKNIWECN